MLMYFHGRDMLVTLYERNAKECLYFTYPSLYGLLDCTWSMLLRMTMMLKHRNFVAACYYRRSDMLRANVKVKNFYGRKKLTDHWPNVLLRYTKQSYFKWNLQKWNWEARTLKHSPVVGLEFPTPDWDVPDFDLSSWGGWSSHSKNPHWEPWGWGHTQNFLPWFSPSLVTDFWTTSKLHLHCLSDFSLFGSCLCIRVQQQSEVNG